MNCRLSLTLAIAALVSGAGFAACGPAPSGAQPTGTPTASVSVPAGTPASPAVTGGAPGPTCVGTSGLVAVRATERSTGFPVPVEWIGLGPDSGAFFTQSDVAPRIPIDPVGPSSITIGMQYVAAAGDRYKLTGGSLTLAYDPATGRLSGTLDTGYGKNANRATTDTVPSQFEGVYTRGPDPGGGVLEGTITHPDRESYHFRVRMVEQEENTVAPGCASPRPTDSL